MDVLSWMRQVVRCREAFGNISRGALFSARFHRTLPLFSASGSHSSCFPPDFRETNNYNTLGDSVNTKHLKVSHVGNLCLCFSTVPIILPKNHLVSLCLGILAVFIYGIFHLDKQILVLKISTWVWPDLTTCRISPLSLTLKDPLQLLFCAFQC